MQFCVIGVADRLSIIWTVLQRTATSWTFRTISNEILNQIPNEVVIRFGECGEGIEGFLVVHLQSAIDSHHIYGGYQLLIFNETHLRESHFGSISGTKEASLRKSIQEENTIMMARYDSKFRMACTARDTEGYIVNSEVVIEPSPWPFEDVFVAGAIKAVLWLSWRHCFVFLWFWCII